MRTPPPSISCTSEAGQDSFRETQNTEELQGTAGSWLLSANHGQDVPPAWPVSYNLMISGKEIASARQAHLLQSCLFFVRFVLLPCVTPDFTITLADKTMGRSDGGMGQTMDVAQSHPLIFLRFKKKIKSDTKVQTLAPPLVCSSMLFNLTVPHFLRLSKGNSNVPFYDKVMMPVKSVGSL